MNANSAFKRWETVRLVVSAAGCGLLANAPAWRDTLELWGVFRASFGIQPIGQFLQMISLYTGLSRCTRCYRRGSNL